MLAQVRAYSISWRCDVYILLVRTNVKMKEKLVILFRKEKAREEESVFQPVLELIIVSVSTEVSTAAGYSRTLTRHHFVLPSMFDIGQQAFSC